MRALGSEKPLLLVFMQSCYTTTCTSRTRYVNQPKYTRVWCRPIPCGSGGTVLAWSVMELSTSDILLCVCVCTAASCTTCLRYCWFLQRAHACMHVSLSSNRYYWWDRDVRFLLRAPRRVSCRWWWIAWMIDSRVRTYVLPQESRLKTQDKRRAYTISNL